MGVNLGAAMSPLLCGYIGETYGWHYGFGLATIGMLTGIAVFVAPIRITQILILAGAIATAVSLLFIQDNVYQLAVNAFVGLALVVAAAISFVALNRGGLPAKAGAPPDLAVLKRKFGPLRADFAVYLGVRAQCAAPGDVGTPGSNCRRNADRLRWPGASVANL